VVKRARAACGGIGGVWRCELYEGSVLSQTCSGSGFGFFADNSFTAIDPEASSGTATQTVTSAPPGTCSGTVNGVLVNLPCPSSTGSTTATSTTTSTSSTGSATVTISTTTDTTCDGGSCTTTKTVTAATTAVSTTTGVVTSTAVTTATSVQTIDDFCKANPLNMACKDAVVNRTSGSCATFTCDGDAALCAIARATQAEKCLLDTPSAESALYDVSKVLSGTGLTSETVAISSASFDQTDLLAGGSCIIDKVITINVAGDSRTFSLPFSNICTVAGYLGNILVALSLLTAMMIVFRRTA
jgi:hypothetical protein